MAPRPSLVVAIAAFTAAVVVLAVDSAWGVRVAIEWQDADGTWHALAPEGEDAYAPRLVGDESVRVPGNGSVDFRVRVANDRPLALSDPIRVAWEAYAGTGAHAVTPVNDVVRAGAFATVLVPFTLSHAELAPGNGTDERGEPFPSDRGGSLFVTVGDRVTVQWIRVVVVS